MARYGVPRTELTRRLPANSRSIGPLAPTEESSGSTYLFKTDDTFFVTEISVKIGGAFVTKPVKVKSGGIFV